MTTEPIILTERKTVAASTVICTPVARHAQVFYDPARDVRTPAQRAIEQHFSMPDTEFRVMLGDLELFYADQSHLAGINMYFNFANAEGGAIGEVQTSNAPPIFLEFPDLAKTDRDIIKYPVQWRAHADRTGHFLRLSVVHRQADRFVTIADRIFLGIDAGGSVAEMLFTAVNWQD